MKNETISKMIEITRIINALYDGLENLLQSSPEVIGRIPFDLMDIILDEWGVPKDAAGVFCRDNYYEKFLDCFDQCEDINQIEIEMSKFISGT